ncbi:MAG: glycosyltransferase family 2 protein [bacterium]
MIKILFFFSLFLIFYTYLLYPLVIFCLNIILRQKKDHLIDESFLPSVSVVVVAHNEKDVIQEKIENCLSLDYPKEKLEIFFASDASTDGTDEIIAQYQKKGAVRFLPVRPRGGKSNALNIAMPHVRGEIVVFSDANTFVQKDAVRKLIRHFADPDIGCVSGRLQFRPVKGNPLGMIESRFWNYETWVKIKEGNIASLPGANGGIYAIRRLLFRPLPIDRAIMDDFIITLRIIGMGYRAISDPQVKALEDTCIRVVDSFEQKIRIGAGNFHGLKYIYPLLSPTRGLIAYILWSHKIIRWFLPFCLMAALISNIFLVHQGRIYQYLIGSQVSFYLVAFLGFLCYLGNKKKHKVEDPVC